MQVSGNAPGEHKAVSSDKHYVRRRVVEETVPVQFCQVSPHRYRGATNPGQFGVHLHLEIEYVFDFGWCEDRSQVRRRAVRASRPRLGRDLTEQLGSAGAPVRRTMLPTAAEVRETSTDQVLSDHA